MLLPCRDALYMRNDTALPQARKFCLFDGGRFFTKWQECRFAVERQRTEKRKKYKNMQNFYKNFSEAIDRREKL